jgi:hypothetical protein
LKVRAASSCAKGDSIVFSSTAKPGNRLPFRVIEKFPREQFEAFAERLEFRRRSEKSRQFYDEYDSRKTPCYTFDYGMARIDRPNQETASGSRR